MLGIPMANALFFVCNGFQSHRLGQVDSVHWKGLYNIKADSVLAKIINFFTLPLPGHLPEEWTTVHKRSGCWKLQNMIVYLWINSLCFVQNSVYQYIYVKFNIETVQLLFDTWANCSLKRFLFGYLFILFLYYWVLSSGPHEFRASPILKYINYMFQLHSSWSIVISMQCEFSVHTAYLYIICIFLGMLCGALT